MSNERLNRIQADLQRAPTVIYLEGKTDESLLFALAGIARPSSGIHKQVYVVGLKTSGAGGNEIRALVDTAAQASLGGKLGQGGVFGIVDGDGRELSELMGHFTSPHPGPLFSWPAYCIENLLAITWPAAWGVAPDWSTVLSSYVPYAALNRIHVQLQSTLKTLQLDRFQNPASGQALKTVHDVRNALTADQHLIAERNLEAMFDAEVARISGAIAASLEEGHAFVNGKWLVSHHAKERQPGRVVDVLRDEWAKQVLTAGGHPAVRDLWTRIAGEAP